MHPTPIYPKQLGSLFGWLKSGTLNCLRQNRVLFCSGIWTSANGYSCWFGLAVVWIPIGSPKMKGIGILRGIPRAIRIPSHRAPTHQALTMSWFEPLQFHRSRKRKKRSDAADLGLWTPFQNPGSWLAISGYSINLGKHDVTSWNMDMHGHTNIT